MNEAIVCGYGNIDSVVLSIERNKTTCLIMPRYPVGIYAGRGNWIELLDNSERDYNNETADAEQINNYTIEAYTLIYNIHSGESEFPF